MPMRTEKEIREELERLQKFFVGVEADETEIGQALREAVWISVSTRYMMLKWVLGEYE